MAKSKKIIKSNTLYYLAGIVLLLAIVFSQSSISKKADINEATYGGIGLGEVPSVTILTGTGGSYNYAYGMGGGYNGNKKKMDGVTIAGYFYPWGYKGEAPGFNPSKGVQFATADGRYTTYGSSVITHNPPLVYLPAVNIPVYSVTLTTSTGAGYTFSYSNVEHPMDGVLIGKFFYPWGYKGTAEGFNPGTNAQFVTKDGRYTTYGSTVVYHNPKIDMVDITTIPTTTTISQPSSSPVQVSILPPVACKTEYYFNGKRCVPTPSTYTANQISCDGNSLSCSQFLAKFVPGQTNGSCYRSWGDCVFSNIINKK